MPRSALSVQLYSIRDALATDPADALTRIQSIGFTAVEPYNLTEGAASLAPLLAERQLAAPSAHSTLVGVDLDAAFRAATAIETSLLIDSGVAAEFWQDADQIARTADALNAAAERGATEGISVGYHNHWWELESRVGDLSGMEYLITLLDDRVRLEVDTYWAAVAGKDVPALLSQIGDRVAAIHVKDGPLDRDPATQLPAGEGVMPIGDILTAAGDAIPVIEFDAYAGDIFAGIAAARTFVLGQLS